MSDAALTGVPDEFPHGGLIYKVSPRTLGAECLFQTWLEREAYLALVRHRDVLGEAEFAEARRDWGRDCAARVYAWGKARSHDAHFSKAGLQYMLFLKINEGATRGGPKISEEGVAQLAADPEAWGQLLDLLMRQDFPDPNPEKGAEAR